jgi:beta-glucosidase/6-phospho-beta-glucosidase/beta-galactosidase
MQLLCDTTRYHDMLDVMEAAGIEPNATLHHFTHPQVLCCGVAWRV